MLKVNEIVLLVWVFLAFGSEHALAQDSPESLQFELDSIITLDESEEKAELLNNVAWRSKYIDKSISKKAGELAFTLSEKNGYASQSAFALKIAGILDDEEGKYVQAVEKYNQAIARYQSINDSLSVAKCEANIGKIYHHIRKNEEAIISFRSSFVVFGEYDFPMGQMICVQSIGVCHLELGNSDSALVYCLKAKDILEELGGIDPDVYMNLGLSYVANADTTKGLENLHIANEIYEKYAPHDINRSVLYQNLSSIYEQQNELVKAAKYIDLCMETIGDNYYNREGTYQLKAASLLNYNLGNYKQSAFWFNELDKVKDSLYTADNLAAITEMREKYESEKKELEIQTLNQEKDLEEVKRKREEEKVFYFGIGGVLLAILLIWIVIALIQKSRSNKEIRVKNEKIEFQKSILEEKNHEIVSSIEYALRIQKAILPPQAKVAELMPDSFILYQPKDIVAGDFYWIEKEGSQLYFAAADCTGHGVPGAMVSVVCSAALNKSLKELNLRKPGEILDATANLVTEQFSNSDEEVKDGMDIALCVLDGKKLSYAGANNPLWICREGEIIEVKANKQPIGEFEKRVNFDTHEIDLIENDVVYVFSDGYPDQFGGEKGKKMKTKAFKQILKEIFHLPMVEQKKVLYDKFEFWRGELEQVDDVCIIGLKIK